MDTLLVETRHSVCPHDCPSACALDVEVSGGTVRRLRGAEQQTYTAGVICAKVARYAERLYHPDRLLHPLRRSGPKGSSEFQRISWDEAFDEIAARFLAIEREHGAEAIWPYKYAGTMGLVQRDGLDRLAHVKKYSRQYDTICTNMAWAGYVAGTGRLGGPDPREMAKSDCVVIWGTNAVSTQVNVMTHAMRARKERGAKIVVIDIYQNDTMKQADMPLLIRPGTDGALACGVMPCAVSRGVRRPGLYGAICRRSSRWARADILQPARPNGRRPSPGLPSPRSKPLRASSARPNAAIFAWAMASRAVAMVRSICTRRSRSRP